MGKGEDVRGQYFFSLLMTTTELDQFYQRNVHFDALPPFFLSIMPSIWNFLFYPYPRSENKNTH